MSKVFGIGLTRTGTTSLAQAMQILGYKSLHTPTNIQQFWEYDFTGDHFTTCRYKFLDHIFPDAKFILTLREVMSWLKSNKIYFDDVVDKESNGNVRLDLAELRFSLYGSIRFEPHSFIRSYYRHLSEVMEHFKDRMEKVLFLDICSSHQGWDKLCPFLNKEIPKDKFPYLNLLNKAPNGEWAVYHKLMDDNLLTSDKGTMKAMIHDVTDSTSNIDPEIRQVLKKKLEDEGLIPLEKESKNET